MVISIPHSPIKPYPCHLPIGYRTSRIIRGGIEPPSGYFSMARLEVMRLAAFASPLGYLPAIDRESWIRTNIFRLPCSPIGHSGQTQKSIFRIQRLDRRLDLQKRSFQTLFLLRILHGLFDRRQNDVYCQTFPDAHDLFPVRGAQELRLSPLVPIGLCTSSLPGSLLQCPTGPVDLKVSCLTFKPPESSHFFPPITRKTTIPIASKPTVPIPPKLSMMPGSSGVSNERFTSP